MSTKADDVLAGLNASETETPENDPTPAGGRADGEAAKADAVDAAKTASDAKAQADAGKAKSAADAKAGADTAGDKPAAEGGGKPDSGREPAVPVARLVAERKHFQEEVRSRDTKISDLETRLKALEKPAEKEPEPPDYLDDPKGYVDAVAAKADQSDKIKTLEKQIADEKAAREQLVLQQQAANAIRAQEAEFVGKTPDYYEALEHARRVRAQQLKIDYPEAEDSAIEGELTRQELAYAFGQVARGANPAERAYAYAKTLGYTPKQAEAAAKTDGGKQDASTQTRADDGKFKKPDAAEIEAAASLGAGGGELAADEAAMSEKDMFDAARTERFGKRA